MTAGCDEVPPTFVVREPAMQVRTINGHAVPAFATAEEQLAYTRSSFAGLEEKQAALEAVVLLFPEAAQERGEVALELAYLRLGPDYRLASVEAKQAALAAYQAIVASHARFPAIAARAQWYAGWIACTLMQDQGRGLAAFRAVVERYPQVQRATDLSRPLVSLTASPPAIESPASGDEPVLWADLALLAMVRCAEDEATARSALLQLHQRDPRGRCTGLALRELLQRPAAMTEAIDLGRAYLAAHPDHPPLAADISALLPEHRQAVTPVLPPAGARP